jgi:predicted SnoaL-like aldol condensation-catalyzing enzyme
MHDTQRNLAVVEKWVETWNEDVDRMVDECYSPDCVLTGMSSGMVLHGREELRSFEHDILAHAPARRMRVERMIATGDTVVVECELTGFTTRQLACMVLRLKDGLIMSDHSYGPPAGSLRAL